jgi:hypothetical protein
MVGCTEPATAALNAVTLKADKGVKEKLKARTQSATGTAKLFLR